MRHLPIVQIAAAFLLSVVSSSINCSVSAQSAASPPSTGPQMPSDIDPRSGMRLSLPNQVRASGEVRQPEVPGMDPFDPPREQLSALAAQLR